MLSILLSGPHFRWVASRAVDKHVVAASVSPDFWILPSAANQMIQFSIAISYSPMKKISFSRLRQVNVSGQVQLLRTTVGPQYE
jgi:hypothetical protein